MQSNSKPQSPAVAHRLIYVWLLLAAVLNGGKVHGHDNPGYSHDSEVKTHNPDWMGALADDTRISRISIPGTHDTMALHTGGDIAL